MNGVVAIVLAVFSGVRWVCSRAFWVRISSVRSTLWFAHFVRRVVFGLFSFIRA